MMIVETHSNWQHFHARFAEWLNAGLLFLWGVYLLTHPTMFTDDRTKALWTGLYAYAEQPTWAACAMLIGFARITALYINGSHKRTPLVRLVTSFFSAFIWTQVTTGLVNAHVPNTGVVVYAGLVVADIYSAFKASRDVTFITRHEQTVKAGLGRASKPVKSS
jgi:hypothetical protein